MKMKLSFTENVKHEVEVEVPPFPLYIKYDGTYDSDSWVEYTVIKKVYGDGGYHNRTFVELRAQQGFGGNDAEFAVRVGSYHNLDNLGLGRYLKPSESAYSMSTEEEFEAMRKRILSALGVYT